MMKKLKRVYKSLLRSGKQISKDKDKWSHYYRTGRDLYDKYTDEGNPVHLSDAIDEFQKALKLRPHGDSDRSYTLDELGSALLKRYEGEGDLDDLTQAIACHQENLILCPPGDADRAVILNNLSNALQKRYELEGNLADLMRVIELNQQALDLRPPGHSDRSTSLNNLAVAFQNRYEREGEVADLAQMIQLNQQALDLHPPGHPDRSMSLNNLCHALYKRYEREGNLTNLVKAIQLGQQALDLRPPGHPDRSMSLNSIAVAIQKRYEREGDLEDLVQVIQLNHQALDLRPPGHPLRSTSLNNLAGALHTRFQLEGDLTDLTLAIKLREQSLDLCPQGHPFRSSALTRLANTLFVQYNAQKGADHSTDNRPPGSVVGATEPLEHAEQESIAPQPPDPLAATITSLLREASQGGNCSPMDCLHAAIKWIWISQDIDPDSTLEAYVSALQQLDIVLAFGQSLDQRQDRLLSDDLILQTRGLGDEAATWAIQRGEMERAIELLEQGRTLLLAQVGRYRAELDDLRRVDSGVADLFADLSRQLDASVVSNKQIEEASSMINDQYGRYWTVSTEWNRTVDQIRMLPGFETFMKPMPYDRLRSAAAEGPIVVIVPNEISSDALIVREDSPPHHVHLPLANSYRLTGFAINIAQILNPEYDKDVRTDSKCADALRCLWSEVVQPISHALQHDLGIPLHTQVWWCPTAAASFLPLHAAGLYSKTQPKENFPDLYISSYTTTLQALLRARRFTEATTPKKLLVVSQPHTPGEPPLNHAVTETEIISKAVSPTQEVTLLSAEKGTCKGVELEMESHPWVHFVCHGVQADGRPLDSYLSLHDGHLTLRNIIERNLPDADFAFLAACHSASGNHALSNEGLHLAAAMQFAGFRGVVGTLWKMADEDGPALAEAFYRDMVQHGDSRRAAVALSKAIKQLRRNKVPINRWIRFIHIGV